MKKINKPFIFGILFVALFALIATLIAETEAVRYLSFSPLIVGIILGMIYGNTLRKYTPHEWWPGITFSAKKILRLAIILYGFRLTFQHVINIGATAVIIDIIVITATILLGLLIGKLLKMDEELSLLTATGSAICGAAAVLGAEPVLNNKPYKTAVAVSTVVIFGTISMFLYPVMFRANFFDLTPQQWAIYTGATVHEVAHVVGAGNAMGESIASSAIIVKMIRVIFLAPVLLVFSFFISRRKQANSNGSASATKIMIPWFAIWFIVVIGFNSLHLLPQPVVDGINYIDTFLLTMAMTALGIETSFSKFKEAGVKPFVLALALFLFLIFGGYMLVKYFPVI
ncbi:YeiH family protein [Dysgonomonas sp. 511]|uniref:YeiH family protein n=1 Tax=Dysgonomonas sp. 511 TaxID=2302930 RepID=UPI0013D872AB|nr:YeiH family protein [Dysgonomonas sp. 511]NDV79754.1 YeiH family protein [Dysgonomonas sp. 511]